MQATNLKTNHLTQPLGIDAGTLFLSWQCAEGVCQTAYEIEVTAGAETLWASGKILSSMMHTETPTPVPPKMQGQWRIRLWDENDQPGAWSTASFETGLAQALGKAEDAAQYRDTAEKAVKAYRAAFTNNGTITSDRQCEYVRAIAFTLLGEEESQAAADTLNRMVVENGYHLNTGFLSTPFLCEVLAKYGYADTAYKLLLQDTAPSWLVLPPSGRHGRALTQTATPANP